VRVSYRKIIKYFLKKKSSLNHHITKQKRPKKENPTPFLQQPHPTPPKLKISHLPNLKNNQTSPSHATQETNLWVSPNPKRIQLFQSLKKNFFWKGVELPHPPLLTQKNTFLKNKIKFLIPHPVSLKLHLKFVILSI
jgi:hypothetical protein